MSLSAMNLFIVLSAVLISCTDVSGDQQPWETNADLPANAVPLSYEVSVRPDLDLRTYAGNVRIVVRTTKTKTHLWLHHRNHNISNAVVKSVKSKTYVGVRRTFASTNNGFVVIELATSITSGDYELLLQYRGIFMSEDVALEFFLHYKDSDGVPRPLFFSTRTFPCFYQENFKAVFQMQVIHKSGDYIVQSNTNPESEIPDTPSKGLTTVKFKKTPVIHPIAISIVINSLDKLPTQYTPQGIAVTLYGRTSSLKNLQHTLQVSVDSFTHYTGYYNFNIPMEKYDIIVVPEDWNTIFSYFGLSFFLEELQIYEPGITPEGREINIVRTAAHYIAYFWNPETAGITFDSDLFLYEGIASYLRDKVVNHIFPTWDMMRYLMIITYYYGMSDDTDLERRALVATVPFNRINFNEWGVVFTKGPAMVRMIESFMGAENMQNGFIDYTKKFAFNSAGTDDLWAAMQTYAPQGVNIRTVMRTWVEQNTFPLVNTSWNNNKLTLTQTRFLVNKNAKYDPSGSEFKWLWIIPITIIGSDGFEIKNPPVWLEMDKPLTIDVPPSVTWLKLNVLQNGFYRALYDDKHWRLLANVLYYDTLALDPIDRGHLLEEVFTLAESDYVSFETALELTKYLHLETHFLPLFTIINIHIYKIAAIMKFTPGYELYRRYFANKLEHHINPDVWKFSPFSSPVERLRQKIIVVRACGLRVKTCLAAEKRMFDSFIHCGQKPPVDIVYNVYYNGMSVSGQDEFYEFLKRYYNEPAGSQKDDFRTGICQIPDPWTVLYLLDTVEKEEFVRFLEECVNNDKAILPIWTYLRQNWEKIAAKLPDNFPHICQTVIDVLSTHVQLKEVKAFFEDVPAEHLPASDRQDILKGLEDRVATKIKYADRLTKWFLDALQHPEPS